ELRGVFVAYACRGDPPRLWPRRKAAVAAARCGVVAVCRMAFLARGKAGHRSRQGIPRYQACAASHDARLTKVLKLGPAAASGPTRILRSVRLAFARECR